METRLEHMRLVRFGPFEANFTTGELRKHGIRLKLQDQPFQVLKMLLARPGQLVTREEIRQTLWHSGTFVDFDNGLNAAVNRLREALGDSAENHKFVETLPRRGYRFIGALDDPAPTDLREELTASAQSARPPATEGAADTAGSGVRGLIGKRLKVIAAASLTIAVIGAASYFEFRRTLVLTAKDTIVLADFTNSTGDPVFDGTLRQGLSVQLEQSPFLSAISDQEIQQTLPMMGQRPDAKLTPDLARDLCQRVGSRAYVEGSIANLGNDYVIGLKAVSCAAGDSLAQEQVQAMGREKVLDSLSHAARTLRQKLGESLSSVQKFNTPLARATTSSLEALQALTLARKAHNNGDFTAAVVSFQRAITLDPNFAVAYSGLAASYADLGEGSLAAANGKKAYELRKETSEPERFELESRYDWQVAGDLEKARGVNELFVQTYPRNANAHFSLGNVYDSLGQYEKGLEQARETLRLEPDAELNYSYLVYSYVTLDRFGEAQDVAEEARAKYPDSAFVHADLYLLAFLENDSTGMARQVAWKDGKKDSEGPVFEFDAYRFACSGQLAKARERTRRAVASAEEAKEKETAASHEADAALREALFGNRLEARQLATAALQRSSGRDVRYAAALALAMAADSAKPQSLADDLARLFPEDTIVRLNYLPTLRAQLALNTKDAAKAIEMLRVTSSSYELMTPANPLLSLDLYPLFVRGQAYLETNQGSEAASEFQKILDHRGLMVFEPIWALAHLGLARATVLRGDLTKAQSAYQDFFTLWKNADPDIPILKQAKAEYAKLQ
jgi:DNA-binding winged helix-turn-helix (wHTH) protein/tetratricopeptide (TPR) repeat protein